jgi:hypothetical protein
MRLDKKPEGPKGAEVLAASMACRSTVVSHRESDASPDRRAAERPSEHDLELRHGCHQRFLQKPELTVPDAYKTLKRKIAARCPGVPATRSNARRSHIIVDFSMGSALRPWG